MCSSAANDDAWPRAHCCLPADYRSVSAHIWGARNDNCQPGVESRGVAKLFAHSHRETARRRRTVCRLASGVRLLYRRKERCESRRDVSWSAPAMRDSVRPRAAQRDAACCCWRRPRGMAGRQLILHCGGDRGARRTRGRGSSSSDRHGRVTQTDLEPYGADAFAADMVRLTEGRADLSSSTCWSTTRATRCAGCASSGSGCASCTTASRTRWRDRHVFWGGLHIGALDGGQGLIADHRARGAARRHRGAHRQRGHRADPPTRDGAVTGVRCHGRRPARPRSTRARPSSAAGGFEADPRRARRATSGPNWDRRARCAGPRTTPARCSRRCCAGGAPRYGHWSGCHSIAWDAGCSGDRRPRADQPAARGSPIRSASSSTATASGSSTRAPTSATTPTPATAPRSCASRALSPPSCSTPAPRRCCARWSTSRPASRARGRDGRRSLPTRSPSTAGAWSARLRSSTAPVADDRVRSGGQGRQGHASGSPRRSPTGRCRCREPPFLGFAVTCGITFTFGGVRIDERGARA